MDNTNIINRIMAGDIPSLEDVTPKELSVLVTLLQGFHLGRAMGQDNTPTEAQFDLFEQLKLLKATLSDNTRREAVKEALIASWPKAEKPASGTPTNSLSIKSTNERNN